MGVIYFLHIAAGSLALLSGYIALYSAKGRTLHRRSGMVFVYAMLVMCVAGTTIAAVSGVAPAVNIPAGLLTSYMVITSLTTVRSVPWWSRSKDIAMMLLAFGIGAACLKFSAEALSSPSGTRNGMPAFPFILFAFGALLGGALDLRIIVSGPLAGARRLTRHLWRMTFALLIAALSFFIGQAKVFPKPIRIMPLLALPVLAVLVTIFYWLWRVRIRGRIRGMLVNARE